MNSPANRLKERGIHVALFFCALVSVLTTLGIVVVLVEESARFFAQVSPVDFFTGRRWAPLLEPRAYGVLPLLCGTFLVAGGALLVAIPVGLASAVFLSEYASPSVRSVLKPLLEVLAGIPTVVYGFFALTFITPHILRPLFPQTDIFNAASAALVMGVMIIPTISSLCDDAFRAVPRSLREAGYAMAATRLEVSTRIVVPSAMSGVVAAILLALSRAIGETMIVAVAAGMTPKMSLNPLESCQTLTSYMVQVMLGDTPAGTLDYFTIFAVGITLFLLTLMVNLIALRVLRRFREVYE